MSYDVRFKVKVEGLDKYVTIGCGANITWNLRDMITHSTGLEWRNCENNGLVKDVMPYIIKGYDEITQHPEKYKKYESRNGWGSINGCRAFYEDIINSWNNLKIYDPDLIDVVSFWIE